MKRLLKFGGILSAVVVILLFVLGAVLRPRALTARTSIHLQSVAAASSAYFGIYSRWPGSLQDLDSASTLNPSKIAFLPPTDSILTDAWGHALIYEPFNSTNGSGRVLSLGRDGLPGGTGYDADFSVEFGQKNVALHTSSISPDSDMHDPWGNPYEICLPGKELVMRSADPIYVDPWGNPYKIVLR